ncbi:MAG: enoyl-CoA hydratase/carnithine racemase [Actinomycetia bacterium]|nr:enoyl-CoA hydratase/carnithine racemase [Actinomycetes bacterium]
MSDGEFELIHTERRPNGVELLRLDHPPVNALNGALLEELAIIATRLAVDPTLKAVVVTGNGKSFAAGADITEFGGEAAARTIGAKFRRAFDAVAAIPRPVIAAVNGFALGGGYELALSCDLRVATEKTRIGQPEILLGIIPGAGGTQRLARLVGPARAKEIVWSGRQIKADEALRIGLVDRVVPVDDLLDAATDWADTFASGPVVAIGLAKLAIDGGLDGSLSAGLDLEAEHFAEVFATEDASIGVTSFLENGPGKARFQGR